jgi:hypothetical protein
MQQVEPPQDLGVGPLFKKVQVLYHQQFREWFAITAPTSVIAAFVLYLAHQRMREIFLSIPRGTIPYHRLEMAEAGLYRFGSFFIAWLLGCIALGAIATVVCNLDRDLKEDWLRDSHQRTREHFGAIFTVALLTFIAFLVAVGALSFVEFAMIKIFRSGFYKFTYWFGVAGYVAAAGLVSWFGAAIPLVLREDMRAWASLRKSLEASDGYQGFLLLLVIETVVGSYVAWYATHYFLQYVVTDSIRFSAWYIWIALLVGALASAAVQPPMFIGFSLLAEVNSTIPEPQAANVIF